MQSNWTNACSVSLDLLMTHVWLECAHKNMTTLLSTLYNNHKAWKPVQQIDKEGTHTRCQCVPFLLLATFVVFYKKGQIPTIWNEES